MRHGRRSSDAEERAAQVRQPGADRARAQAGGHEVRIIAGVALQPDGRVDRGAPGIHGGDEQDERGPWLARPRRHAEPTATPKKKPIGSAPDPGRTRIASGCSGSRLKAWPQAADRMPETRPSAAKVSAGRLRKVLLKGIAGMAALLRCARSAPIRPEDSAEDTTAGGPARPASAMSRGRSTRASRKCPVSAKPARTSSSRHGAGGAGAQERRQRQQPLLVGLAGRGRHGAARLRRDVDEVGRLPRSPRRRQDRGRSPAPPAAPAPSAPSAPATRRGSSRIAQHEQRDLVEARDADRARAAGAPALHSEVRPASAARILHRLRGDSPCAARRAKWPRCSASRAFHAASTWLPVCSTGRSLRERPPCTRPRWRPCARVKSSSTAAGLAVRPARDRITPSSRPLHASADPHASSGRGSELILGELQGPSRGSARDRPPSPRAP